MKRVAGITYDDWGAGDLPIVCLHGIGGDTGSFGPQLDGLSEGRRVIAWNMPGYGGSDAISPVTFERLSAALILFLDALGFQRVHLVGQSIGGMVALETAVRYPERVAGLSLIATTPAFGGRDESFKEAFVAARLKPLDEGQTLADLAKGFVPEITGPDASAEVLAAATASMAAVPEATYRDIIACLVTFNRRAEISDLDLPVCVIAGGFDTNAPAKTMASMAAKIPGAEYHLIERAGHLVNLEAGDETNEILANFHNKLEGQP